MNTTSKEFINSNLEDIFSKLSVKSKNSIVNQDEFNEFNEYMHIARPIQKQLEDYIDNFLLSNDKKSIIFIVGNVGDGKSHILSYMTNKYSEQFKKFHVNIHNDATETTSPQKTAIETLIDLLSSFDDSTLNNANNEKLIIAINLGVLTNLFEKLKSLENFKQLVSYIKKTDILENYILKDIANDNFKIISFIGQSNISIDKGNVTSSFYKSALKKVYSQEKKNPFYNAFSKDIETGHETIIHKNYRVLMKDEVQETIIYLLIRSEIEFKKIISARTLFNFFYDITIGNKEDNYKSALTYLLFENFDKSDLLNVISNLDPIKNNSKKIDEESIEIYHSPNYQRKVKDLLGQDIENTAYLFDHFTDTTNWFKECLNTYLRTRYLLNHKDILFNNSLYLEYLDIYKSIMQNNEHESIIEKRLLRLVSETYSKWNGNLGYKEQIIKNRFNTKIKILINVRPKPINQRVEGAEIIVEYSIKGKKEKLSIDYNTYSLLNKVKYGYFLKAEDRKNSINFENFINTIIMHSEIDNNEIVLFNVNLGQPFRLSRDTLDKYTLERIQ